MRAAVVAQGKEYYEALQNPAQINADEDFEPLLSLAALAFEHKTGSEFDYSSPLSYETYANDAGLAISGQSPSNNVLLYSRK